MKFLTSILFVGLIVLLSGCFEVVEEVSYNTNESGSYSITANASLSKTRLKTLLELDTFMGADMPDKYDIMVYLDSIEYTIIKSSRAGISNVKKNIDFDNFIFSISFNFNKTETLNLALNNVAKFVAKKEEMEKFNMFDFSNKIFSRNSNQKDAKTDIPDKYKDVINQVSDATFTSIYRFQTPVKSVGNKHSKISKSGKAVMQKQRIPEIIKDPKIFQNTINF